MTLKIQSSRGRTADKPSKPRKDFPLFAHNSGQWAKKINGKMFYFGKWDDPVADEAQWERDKIAMIEGRDPDRATPGDSLDGMYDEFMESKELPRERGELTLRAFNDYLRASKEVANHFGHGRKLDTIRAADFDTYRNSLRETWGPVTINNQEGSSNKVAGYCYLTLGGSRGLERFRRGGDWRTRCEHQLRPTSFSYLDSAATETNAVAVVIGNA